MRVAFLNLCHTDPDIVARATQRLTMHPDFDMYIHIDAKSEIDPFLAVLGECERTNIIDIRHKVYWGGFNAVKATIDLLRSALSSQREYQYFVLLQNLDYPLQSNESIDRFFTSQQGTEFIRACNIARTKDWRFSTKYRIYNKRDDDFYLMNHSKVRLYFRYMHMLLRSIPKLLWNGIIKEDDEAFQIHYGAAQWAVTRACAEFLVAFYDTHPTFNAHMAHIQFPDEEYFHTAVHNSPFKYKCILYDEPERRWLVNWRNLHYFEYPREITVLTEKDFDKLTAQEGVLFIRKVRTGISEGLMNLIDAQYENKPERYDPLPPERTPR